MMRSDKETEKIVGNMLGEHKGYREIMANVHVAPNKIKQIKDKLAGQKPESPKFVQAYRSFSEGKSRLEVAEKLEIRGEEVRQYHIEYLKLEGGDGLSRLARMHGPDFLSQLERMVQSLERNGISPDEYEQYCEKIKSIKALASERKALIESKSKLERDKKLLLEQNGELKFENSKMGATNTCLEAVGESQIQENETLTKRRNQIKEEIGKLLGTRWLQEAAFLRGSRKLSEECFRQRAQDFIGDGLPYIQEAIRKYVGSKGGSVTVDDLPYDEEEIEQILLNNLEEPVEYNLKWIGDILTEDLYEQNGYGSRRGTLEND
jgi:hypothetical protein